MIAVKIKLAINPIFAFKSPVSSHLHFLSLISFSINFENRGLKFKELNPKLSLQMIETADVND